MKGIVFTGFLDLVEDKFGLLMVDQIIEESQLESGGIYTSIGTYSFSEMLQLVTNLSKAINIPKDDLLLIFGEYFFQIIEDNYPGLLATYKDPIEMISSIENHIHIEVRKIYPDAELPTFKVLEKTEDTLILKYSSSRAMHYFGLGLMNKTFEHFNSTASITLDPLNKVGTEVIFNIKKNHG